MRRTLGVGLDTLQVLRGLPREVVGEVSDDVDWAGGDLDACAEAVIEAM